jgi:hypothetical protein
VAMGIAVGVAGRIAVTVLFVSMSSEVFDTAQ